MKVDSIGWECCVFTPVGPMFSTFPGVQHSSGSAGGSENFDVEDIRERTDHAFPKIWASAQDLFIFSEAPPVNKG